jgi:transposase-like protein
MKQADAGKQLTKSILLGLAQGDYERVASQFVDGFGLSQSSVGRRFQEQAKQALQEFESRSPKTENFLALWIDGMHVAGEQMIVAMGAGGGRIQEGARVYAGHDRKCAPIIEMLCDLIERNLACEDGILCVIGGAKGLRKAIREVFGVCAPVQRCRWLWARERGQLSAEGRAERLAEEAAARLPGTAVRSGEKAAA